MAKYGSKIMKSETIVEVNEVKMAYRRTRHRVSTLKQTAIQTIKKKMQYEIFYALDGISFTINKGETVSIIGKNGAGKSTLLKVVARVLPPSSGRVIVRGNVAPMIELGAGFNPELTGVENVMLYGTLMGRSVKHMKSRIEAIADWAGLTDQLDVPLRAYSSGMVARLAFAIATDEVPDLLLIDEVLSVGDEDFKKKSAKRTEEMIKGGCAVLLVTHDLSVVKELSQKAIYLDKGKIKAVGKPKSVIQSYLNDVEN